MNQETAKLQIDDLLFPLINAHSEQESEAVLEDLICNHARPLINEIISFKLKAYSGGHPVNRDDHEVEDVSSEVILQLVRTLRLCKSSPQEKAIASFRSYVATMAYNASDQYLRQKYPRRFSLKNKIKYILTHKPLLAMWESDNRQVSCGFASWRQSKRASAHSLPNDQIEVLDVFLRKRFKNPSVERANPASVIEAVFEFTGSPLELDHLVTVMGQVWAIRDATWQSESEDKGHDDASYLSSDPRETLDATFDNKDRLGRVWSEILQLSPRQRAALLLNLRDEQGGTAVVLLPMLRVASLQQIAEAVEMTAEELAQIWNKLPLEDALIGERLGATRQQVANLRKCARERLSRRLTTRNRG